MNMYNAFSYILCSLFSLPLSRCLSLSLSGFVFCRSRPGRRCENRRPGRNRETAAADSCSNSVLQFGGQQASRRAQQLFDVGYTRQRRTQHSAAPTEQRAAHSSSGPRGTHGSSAHSNSGPRSTHGSSAHSSSGPRSTHGSALQQQRPQVQPTARQRERRGAHTARRPLRGARSVRPPCGRGASNMRHLKCCDALNHSWTATT